MMVSLNTFQLLDLMVQGSLENLRYDLYLILESGSSVSLGEFSLTKLQNEIDESDTVSLPSSKSDDDMVARGKPAVVLGYKTTNGVKEPCVMLGLIAHRDMDTIDDLLDPAYAKKVVNEHNTTRLRTMGVKSVRFNLVEEIIPPSDWERYD